MFVKKNIFTSFANLDQLARRTRGKNKNVEKEKILKNMKGSRNKKNDHACL